MKGIILALSIGLLLGCSPEEVDQDFQCVTYTHRVACTADENCQAGMKCIPDDGLDEQKLDALRRAQCEQMPGCFMQGMVYNGVVEVHDARCGRQFLAYEHADARICIHVTQLRGRAREAFFRAVAHPPRGPDPTEPGFPYVEIGPYEPEAHAPGCYRDPGGDGLYEKVECSEMGKP